jgi:diamine N-acetyltransferase
MDEPDLIVVGERVALGPLRKDLAATYARWINSAGVRYGLAHYGISTAETEEKWVEDGIKAGAEREPKTAAFTVYDTADGEPVGTVSLFDINYLHGSAKFGIALGDRRGHGLGTEATRLTVRWGFETLGLHNVQLTLMAWNEQAERAYARAGFRRIGVRRGSVWCRGERTDEILMDATPADLE